MEVVLGLLSEVADPGLLGLVECADVGGLAEVVNLADFGHYD